MSTRRPINIHRRAIPVHFAAALGFLICLYPRADAFQSKAQGPDPLIEASRYALFANEAAECTPERVQDPVRDAIRWTLLAIKTARDFKSKDKTEQGIAAAFLAHEVRSLDDLRTTLARLDTIYVKATKQIKEKRVQAAKSILRTGKVPTCDARFATLNEQLDSLRRAADSAVARADTILASEPKSALKLYKDAQQLVTDDPIIAMKIAAAQQHAKTPVGSQESLPTSFRRSSGNVPFPDRSRYRPEASGLGLLWRSDQSIKIHFDADKILIYDLTDAPLAELSLQYTKEGRARKYVGRYFFQAPGFCRGGGHIEVTAWSASRIEGRLERPLPGKRKGNNEPDYDCPKIMHAVGVAPWSPFALVRQEVEQR